MTDGPPRRLEWCTTRNRAKRHMSFDLEPGHIGRRGTPLCGNYPAFDEEAINAPIGGVQLPVVRFADLPLCNLCDYRRAAREWMPPRWQGWPTDRKIGYS